MSYAGKIEWTKEQVEKIKSSGIMYADEIDHMDIDHLATIMNGCGSDHLIKAQNIVAKMINHIAYDLIPQTIFGVVDMAPVCCNHDLRYWLGKTQADKDFADSELLANGYYLIGKANIDPELASICKIVVEHYYEAVQLFGNNAFADKE